MSENKGFPLYVIYSSWSLSAITEFVQAFGGVHYLRILCDYKTKEETNRTLAILKPEVYQALVAAGHDKRQQDVDFAITPFQLKPSHYPGRDKTTKLFIQVPNCLREDESLIRQALAGKFRELAGWGILPEASWSIFIPLESRKLGRVRSGCYVSFRKEVSMEAIAFVKICINDTFWTEDVIDEKGEEPVVLCFWAREFKKDGKKKEKGEACSQGEGEEVCCENGVCSTGVCSADVCSAPETPQEAPSSNLVKLKSKSRRTNTVAPAQVAENPEAGKESSVGDAVLPDEI